LSASATQSLAAAIKLRKLRDDTGVVSMTVIRYLHIVPNA
jgi:hypothetical protein